MKQLFSLFSLLLLFAGCERLHESARPQALRCEYLDHPICIDTPHPRLTWEISDSEPGFLQGAYQIEVASTEDRLRSDDADVWNSGKIQSSDMKAVYNGSTALTPLTGYYWRVKVWDESGRLCQLPEPAYFETALFSTSDWKARWISDGKDKETFAGPMFRKGFQITTANIRRATLYCSGLGYGEFYVNGERVSENEMDPGFTHYHKRVLYNAFAVEDLLREGDNTLAAVLGNGWFNNQLLGVWNYEKAVWRARPQLLCELRIEYTDGSSQVIVSDESWKTTDNGPFIKDNIYSGETYDARKEIERWDEPGFIDSSWQQAVVVNAPASLLRSQAMPPIRVTEEIQAVELKRFSGNIYLFDLGSDFAGVCRLTLRNTEPGTVVTMKHAEMLTPEGRLNASNINHFFRPVDKSDIFQTDTYITRGGEEEVFQPRFTYHGFRYVEIQSSRPLSLEVEDLIGLFMHTDVTEVGAFECSNPLLNTIWQATNRSYLSNLHSIPTDCPQREKNGWTADAHVAMEFGLLNYDGMTVYEKWLNDILDNQNAKGEICGIVPSAEWGYGTGPVWDAAMFVVPLTLYEYYGDLRPIETAYSACERYLSYLASRETDGGLIKYGLGDWLPYKTETPNDYTSTAFYYYCLRSMARFASLTGRDAKAWEEKAARTKELINKTYFDATRGVYSNGSQTALSTALYFGLVPEGEEKRVAENLYKSIVATNYHLDFGLLGSKFVPAMLTRYGYVDAAFAMVTQEDHPSWGFWFKQYGATALYESWNINISHFDGSLNHVFLGDVSAWMVKSLAGINYDPDKPGFANVRMTPHFPQKLNEAQAAYRSVRGDIASRWKRENGTITWEFIIPPGSTATLQLPLSVKVAGGTPPVGFVPAADNTQQAEVKAGRYLLTLTEQ